MPAKRFFLIVFLLLISGVYGFAQILNDSLQNKYGTHTTFYTTEADVLNNHEQLRKVDTSLNDLHNFPFLYQRNGLYQDLGVLGTPVNYYGYHMPDRPGRRMGFNAFDPFAPSPSKIQYFDTQSPFAEVRYVQGSHGQQIGEIRLSRNVNWHWNIGLDYRKLATNKIIGLNKRDTLARSNSFDIYTRYFTPGKKRYEILASFTAFNMRFYETGGEQPLPGSTYQELFGGLREQAYLKLEKNNDQRFYTHFYQQYSPFGNKTAQVYLITDWTRRFNWFKSQDPIAQDSTFLANLNVANILPHYYPYSTFNNNVMILNQQEGGLKGKLDKLDYRIWYRHRHIRYNTHYSLDSAMSIFIEHFFGFQAIYNFAKNKKVLLYAEKMLENDYLFKAEFLGKVFHAGYNRMFYSPSLFQIQYTGNYFQWYNPALTPTLTDRLFGEVTIKKKRYFLNASLNAYRIKDYIYQGSSGYREQQPMPIQMVAAKINAGVNIVNIHLDNYLNFYQVSKQNVGNQILRLPPVVGRTRLYYQNHFKKSVAFFQVGIDVNYRAGYYAPKYMPLYNQYFVNSDSLQKGFVYVDLFLNAQLKHVTGFVKLRHANQGLWANGYFITPGYTAIGRTFIFGIIWKFFD